MKLNRFSLEHKWSLITGAAGLLGYYHAEALYENGSNIILTDLNYTKLLKTKVRLVKNNNNNNNQVIICIKMDVSKESSIIKTEKFLNNKKIFIDILINNAALNPQPSKSINKLESYKLSTWDKEISVGLTGAFLCSKHFGNQMTKEKKRGVIINIASDLSIIAPNQNLYKENLSKPSYIKPVTYSVVKHGIIGLTKYLATYWADQNIRCNALSPGGVKNGQNTKFIKRISKEIPMKRMAVKSEYKEAIQFLASDASSYLNGQNIVIDGGRSIW